MTTRNDEVRRDALHSLVLEQMDRAVIASDEDKRIIFANTTAKAWFRGLPSPSADDREWSAQYGLVEMDGVTPLALERNPMFRAFGGESFAGAEFRVLRDGATPRYVRSTGGPLLGADGQRLGAMVVVEDISEARRAQAQLMHAQRLESVGRLAGGVAHDFNNQLTIISGMLDLALVALPAAEPVREDLLQARLACDRAADVTRQLLAFSRQQILQLETADVNAVIRDTIKMLGRLLGDDVVLVPTLADDLPRVVVDTGHLQHALINLAVNARDAMPRGGTVRLATTAVEASTPIDVVDGTLPPGRYVAINVSDDGHGFDVARSAELFDPFVTDRAFGLGAGLGLSAVLGVVAQNHGGIAVASTVGAGSTFTILLPARTAPAMPDPADTAAPTPTDASATILIVDDEPALRTVAAKILRRAGYETLVASGGEEALAIADQHQGPIALLLTDVVMPGTSGVDLARQLSARFPALKVLFTSGYTDDTLFRHGVDEPQVNFIAKPYSLDELTRRVRALLAAAPPTA